VSYPWQLIGLLWMVAFLNSADRSVLFAVMPQLRTQFELTDTQLALISSVFSGYTRSPRFCSDD